MTRDNKEKETSERFLKYNKKFRFSKASINEPPFL